MNRKQLIFLLVVLAVIGSAGMVLLNQHKESWAVHETKMGDKVLPDFQPNAVAGIRIKGDTTLNIVHKNDLWRVQERSDYPANFGQISDLLIKLRDLTVVEAEMVGPSDLGRVNLDEPGKGTNSGTLVEFMDGQGKVIESLLLGKKHARQLAENHSAFAHNDPDGRYILLPGDPKFVLLVSNTLAVLEPRPEVWFNHDFFKPEKVKSIAFSDGNASDSWKMSRESETSPWVLADGKPGETLDAERTLQAANALQYPRFIDVIPANSPVKTGLDKPAVTTIETFDRFIYTIKVGAKPTEESYYLTVNVAGEPSPGDKPAQDKFKQEQSLTSWIYVANTWVLDPLLHNRAQMLQGYKDEKTVEATSPAATPSTVTAPDGPTGAQGWSPRVIK